MRQHTPTPWIVESGEVVTTLATGERATVARAYREPECPISPTDRDANMHRIAACVNACEDISTEALRDTNLLEMLRMAYAVCEMYRSNIQEEYRAAERRGSDLTKSFYRSILDSLDTHITQLTRLINNPERNNE